MQYGAERAYHRVVSRMDHALSQPAGERRDVGLHEARKAAKRLRYAERSDPHWVSRPSGRNAVSRGFKQLLGEYQDTVVSRPVLRELVGQPHLDGGNGFTYGLMHATETNRATRAERKLPARWQKAQAQKTAWCE